MFSSSSASAACVSSVVSRFEGVAPPSLSQLASWSRVMDLSRGLLLATVASMPRRSRSRQGENVARCSTTAKANAWLTRRKRSATSGWGGPDVGDGLAALRNQGAGAAYRRIGRRLPNGPTGREPGRRAIEAPALARKPDSENTYQSLHAVPPPRR